MQVFVCENCLAAINDDGSVLVWKKEWRTLHFQKELSSGRVHESLLNENNAGDKEKKSKHSDLMKPRLNEVVYENTKCTREQIESCFELSTEVKCKGQEGMNKKLKVENFGEQKGAACDDIKTTKINFSKVAVEDNLLLALDTGKRQHWSII